MEKTTNKLVLAIFFFLYLYLPDYFAIEVSGAFPLLTARRILLLMLITVLLLEKKFAFKRISNSRIRNTMIIYAILQLIAIIGGSDSMGTIIKSIFSLFFENILLVLVICNFVDTKERLLNALDCVLAGSIPMILVGILQAFTGVNLASFLYTVDRAKMNVVQERLGIMRATSTMGHSVYFAAACVLLLPFAYERYKETGKKRFLVNIILCIVGVFASFSRGSLIFLGILIIGMIITNITRKKVYHIKKKSLYSVMSALFCFVGVFVVSYKFRNIVTNSAASMLNVFFQNISLAGNNSANDELVNTSILGARFWQLSGIEWILMNHPLFGIGDTYVKQGIYYMYQGSWRVFYTIDMGVVGMFIRRGLFGAISSFILFEEIFKSLSYKYKQRNGLTKTFFVFFLLYILFLFTIDEFGIFFWLFLSLYIAQDKIIKNDNYYK